MTSAMVFVVADAALAGGDDDDAGVAPASSGLRFHWRRDFVRWGFVVE